MAQKSLAFDVRNKLGTDCIVFHVPLNLHLWVFFKCNPCTQNTEQSPVLAKIAGLQTTASHFWGFADTWCSGKDTVTSCKSLPWLPLGWMAALQARQMCVWELILNLGKNPEKCRSASRFQRHSLTSQVKRSAAAAAAVFVACLVTLLQTSWHRCTLPNFRSQGNCRGGNLRSHLFLNSSFHCKGKQSNDVLQTQEISLQWLLYTRQPFRVSTQDPENNTDLKSQALIKAAFSFMQLKHIFPHQKRRKNNKQACFTPVKEEKKLL